MIEIDETLAPYLGEFIEPPPPSRRTDIPNGTYVFKFNCRVLNRLGQPTLKELLRGSANKFGHWSMSTKRKEFYLYPARWFNYTKETGDGRVLRSTRVYDEKIGVIEFKVEDVTPKLEQAKLPNLGRSKGEKHLLKVPAKTPNK